MNEIRFVILVTDNTTRCMGYISHPSKDSEIIKTEVYNVLKEYGFGPTGLYRNPVGTLIASNELMSGRILLYTPDMMKGSTVMHW